MRNPWEEIRLEDYEKHMALDSVRQLQALNGIMKAQMEAYPVKTVMILGVAGGNGLEHAAPEKLDRVYGVDINREYLQAAGERYAGLGDKLRLMCLDLTKDAGKLPEAERVIADLLIEYTGYAAFTAAVKQAAGETGSERKCRYAWVCLWGGAGRRQRWGRGPQAGPNRHGGGGGIPPTGH